MNTPAMLTPDFLTGLGVGAGAIALFALFGWLWLRQGNELAATRLRAELESTHATELRAEAERRTAAETLNARLPETENFLRVTQEENSALSAQVAELETLVDSERRAHVEQQRLLTDARTELSDAFKALSADALRHNNQSFLELANTHLSTFQEAAQGDLAPTPTSHRRIGPTHA